MSYWERITVFSVAALILGLGASSSAIAAEFHVFRGDPADPTTNMMFAYNISHSGKCVVGEALPVDGPHGEGVFAIRDPRSGWELTRIGVFSTTDSHYSPGYDVAANQLTIVGVGSSGDPGVDMAYQFSQPGPIQPLGLYANDLVGEARGINGNGAMMVGWGSTKRSSRFGPTDPYRHALLWTKGGTGPALVDAAPDGPVETVAMAVTNAGHMVVGFAVSYESLGHPYDPSESRGHQGIVWRKHAGAPKRTWLPFLESGAACARAYDVDEQGKSVVGFSGTFGSSKPVMWTARHPLGDYKVQDLGTLPGWTSGGANGISPDGRVVVGSCYNWDGTDFSSTAFVWDEKHGMRDIRELLLAANVAGIDEWTLIDATAASRSGEWICGNASDAEGNLYAWVAELP